MPLNVKKILVGHNYYRQPGGEDGVFRSEIALLKGQGHEVHVYERFNEEIKPDFFSKMAHVTSLRYSKSSYDGMRRLLRVFKPDVAHFHNTFFVMTPSVIHACRDEGVPVAVSLHNFRLMCINGLFLRDGKLCEDCLHGSRISGIIHQCYRDSRVDSALAVDMINYHWRHKTWENVVDRVVVATEFTKQKYVQAGIPADKIRVLPPFVDVIPQVNPGKGGYAFFAGRFSPEKGVDVLLKAWRHVKDFPLYIAGQGPMQEYVENYIREHGLTRVKLLGFIDNQECLRILARARFLVVPSVCYENFPRVVVEAFACGVPVVANDLGTMKEVVQDGTTGFLYAENNHEELAAKAMNLIRDDKLRAQMSSDARRAYDLKYTSARHYEGMMSIYEGMEAHA